MGVTAVDVNLVFVTRVSSCPYVFSLTVTRNHTLNVTHTWLRARNNLDVKSLELSVSVRVVTGWSVP